MLTTPWRTGRYAALFGRRSLAEAAMYRFKQLLAGKISLQIYKRSGRGSDGVYEHDKQTEQLWSARQHAITSALLQVMGGASQ